MLRLTSYWPGLPAGGFRDHGVYSLEPAVAVAHDPVGTGLRLVTAQPSGLTHVYRRQSLFADGAEQVWEVLRGRSMQVFVNSRIRLKNSQSISSFQLLFVTAHRSFANACTPNKRVLLVTGCTVQVRVQT
jgi:hypothetical protein